MPCAWWSGRRPRASLAAALACVLLGEARAVPIDTPPRPLLAPVPLPADLVKARREGAVASYVSLAESEIGPLASLGMFRRKWTVSAAPGGIMRA